MVTPLVPDTTSEAPEPTPTTLERLILAAEAVAEWTVALYRAQGPVVAARNVLADAEAKASAEATGRNAEARAAEVRTATAEERADLEECEAEVRHCRAGLDVATARLTALRYAVRLLEARSHERPLVAVTMRDAAPVLGRASEGVPGIVTLEETSAPDVSDVFVTLPPIPGEESAS